MGTHLRNISISFLFFCVLQSLASIGYISIFIYTWKLYHVGVHGIFMFGVINGVVLLILAISCGISFYQNHRAKKIFIAVLLFSIASCICNVVMALDLKKIVESINDDCGVEDFQTKKNNTPECEFKISFRKELIWLIVLSTAGIVSSVCTKILACMAMAINYDNSLDEEQRENNQIEL